MNASYDLDDPIVFEVFRARTALLYTKPLMAEIALQMDIVILEGGGKNCWCKRAATDGKSIYFNRDFVVSLFFDANKPETRNNGHNRLVAILVHEIYHLMFGHLLRRGGRDKLYWNMAVDYIVNAAIINDKIGLLPEDALRDKRFTMDHTAEEVYDYLVENKVKVKESFDDHIEPEDLGSGGSSGDMSDLASTAASVDEGDGGDIKTGTKDQGPPSVSQDELKRFGDRATMTIIRAVQEGEDDVGTLPGGLRREIAKLVDPRMDWREIINSSLRSIQPFDYTYDELSEVSWASWLYHRARWVPGEPKGYCAILPTQTEGERVEATLAIDTSASMTSEMIRDFLSEIAGIMASFNECEIRVLCFDAMVGSEHIFTERNVSDLADFRATKVKGGGGTDFVCVWDYLKEQNITPDRLVVCTDGKPGGLWGDSKYCETIFLIHNKDQSIKAPFGKTTYFN